MKNCYVNLEHRAIVDLCPYGKGMIITRINVPIEHRGKGIASSLLKNVLRDADDNDRVLYLEIQSSDGLNFEQLKTWYERHGFVEYIVGVWKRRPKKKEREYESQGSD